MKKIGSIFLIALVVISCKSKEDDTKPTEKFWPVLSYIKSQIANVDTSLFTIKKIVIIDSAHSDTTYVKREEFRALAKDFLELPDLTEKGYSKRFTEEKSYDEAMNKAVFRYVPKNAEKEEVQKEEVVITPNNAVGDKVNSFIIEKIINNKDGYLQKNLLWQVDQSFTVTTITQKPGQPEIISTMKVSWNEIEE